MPQISKISTPLPPATSHQQNFRNFACESQKTIKILIKIAYTQRVRIVTASLSVALAGPSLISFPHNLQAAFNTI